METEQTTLKSKGNKLTSLRSKLDELKALSDGSGVEVIVVNPDREDFTRSSTFRIKTIVSDAKTVQEKVAKAFAFYRTGEMKSKVSADSPPGG